MKKNNLPRGLFMTMTTGLSLLLTACSTSSGPFPDHHPFTAHSSINREEVSRQYRANPVWWDKAFTFLRTQDLVNLKPGNYIIDSGNVTAIVTELSPKEKETVNFEAHRNFNDLQYIIRGKAGMGVVPLSDAGVHVLTPYSDSTDTGSYTVTGGEKYYEVTPGTFFIFSPNEVHRPAFKVDGYDTIKKIVIKVRVKN